MEKYSVLMSLYKKEHPDKKIVLIIEDMDRMDPAHLFRILNVFSAHIDYNYRFGVNSNQPFVGNKFGLDKVVFVMSYENTEHIFHHLYGEGADFNGYISKFCSSNIFDYSHSPEKEHYIYKRMAANTNVDESMLRYLVKPELLQEHSVREIVNAIEGLEGFISYLQIKDNEGRAIHLHHGILRAIAIMRKLGMDNFLAYVHRGRLTNVRIHFRNQKGITPSIFEIVRIDDNGKAECSYCGDGTRSDYEPEFSKMMDKVLDMVSA